MVTNTSRLPRILPYAVLCLGVVTGVGALALWLSPTHQPPQQVTSVAAPAPSADKPAQPVIDGHTVAADRPRYLEIPSIGVPKSRVMGLGIDATTHQIAIPNNLHDVGWYDASAKPGHAGAMFAYGHVSGWKSKGIFYNLHRLWPGDTITMTRGDGTVYSYKVVALKRYTMRDIDMQTILKPISGSRQGLNLMTCAGQMDPTTGEFSERLVVFTTPVSE